MKFELSKKQEYYNTMFIGLSQQGWKQSGREYQSQDDDGNTITRVTCLYRGDEGRKCAFGFLIPDDVYYRDLEGTGVCGSQFTPWFGGEMDEEDGYWNVPEDGKELRRFLADAQRIHDNNSDPDEMRDQFRQLAVNYDLTIPNV